MIFAYSFFEGVHPKYLNKIADMMKNANNCIFLNRDELNMFMVLLINEFKVIRSKGKDPILYEHIDENNTGMLAVYLNDHANNSVIRLYLQQVREVLLFNPKTIEFDNVIDRIKLESEDTDEDSQNIK
jgi:hypothetical protein